MPILYFGGGEGETLVDEFDLGWVAEAGNYDALNRVIKGIEIDDLNMNRRSQIKHAAETHFNFEHQLMDTIGWLETHA